MCYLICYLKSKGTVFYLPLRRRLRIRVSRTGKNRFFVLYRQPEPDPARFRKTKRPHQATYGDPPDIGLAAARQAVREVLAAVGEGREPRVLVPSS